MKVVLVIFLLLLWWGWPSKERQHPAGQIAPHPPLQFSVRNVRTLQHGDYRLTPLAGFDISARVLAKEDYYLGRESDLSPTDLAMGWSIMSDSQILKEIEISQSGRWYRWRTNQLPAPQRDIERSSANMHIIPAEDGVAKQLERVRQGDLVRVEGYLVRVDAADGWHWVSSLTREDVGHGACELIYAQRLTILTP